MPLSKDNPNNETKEALAEYPEMKKDKKKYKRYASIEEVMKDNKL